MECPICYCEIKDTDLEILKCGHKFNHECILLSFKNNTQYNTNNMKCIIYYKLYI